MKREPYIVANWKMHKNYEEVVSFIENLRREEALLARNSVLIAPAFPYIYPAAKAARGSPILIGSQNINDKMEGAYTGEVSALMVRECGGSFTLIGHSERRHFFHEDNHWINRKVHAAFRIGIRPILCLGETLKERESGNTENVLKKQLLEGLEGVEEDKAGYLLIAYEPFWAIGSGKSATADQVEQMHSYCRMVLGELWGKEVAKKIPILYGGSVNAGNAKALLIEKNVDGLLVGGASLSLDSFKKILYDGDLNS